MHVGGRYWHPNGGSVTPGDNTNLLLHEGLHEATQFLPISVKTGEIVSINGAALAGGRWEAIYSVIDAQATQSRTVSTTIGMEQKQTSEFGYSVTTEISMSFGAIFSSKVSQTSSFRYTSSQTWRESTTIQDSFTVQQGQSLVVWQYVYEGQYANQRIGFRSNIFHHTKSLSEVPQERFE